VSSGSGQPVRMPQQHRNVTKHAIRIISYGSLSL
jgi:hypothetical protein